MGNARRQGGKFLDRWKEEDPGCNFPRLNPEKSMKEQKDRHWPTREQGCLEASNSKLFPLPPNLPFPSYLLFHAFFWIY